MRDFHLARSIARKDIAWRAGFVAAVRGRVLAVEVPGGLAPPMPP